LVTRAVNIPKLQNAAHPRQVVAMGHRSYPMEGSGCGVPMLVALLWPWLVGLRRGRRGGRWDLGDKKKNGKWSNTRGRRFEKELSRLGDVTALSWCVCLAPRLACGCRGTPLARVKTAPTHTTAHHATLSPRHRRHHTPKHTEAPWNIWRLSLAVFLEASLRSKWRPSLCWSLSSATDPWVSSARKVLWHAAHSPQEARPETM